MSFLFPLSDHNNTPQDEGPDSDMFWGFTLKAASPFDDTNVAPSMEAALANLLKDPKKTANANNSHPHFLNGKPIVIVFQYVPFEQQNKWFIHGVNHTNIVSVRCPSFRMDPEPMKRMKNTIVDVNYMTEPVLAVGHFDPKASELPWEIFGKLLHSPALLANSLNAQIKSIKKRSSSKIEEQHLNTGFKDVIFTLSANFRFRYELRPPDGSHLDEEMQCVKFAGTYWNSGYSTDGSTMVMQIDEAWSMRWQSQKDMA